MMAVLARRKHRRQVAAPATVAPGPTDSAGDAPRPRPRPARKTLRRALYGAIGLLLLLEILSVGITVIGGPVFATLWRVVHPDPTTAYGAAFEACVARTGSRWARWRPPDLEMRKCLATESGGRRPETAVPGLPPARISLE
jgi:hypothetical protein